MQDMRRVVVVVRWTVNEKQTLQCVLFFFASSCLFQRAPTAVGGKIKSDKKRERAGFQFQHLFVTILLPLPLIVTTRYHHCINEIYVKSIVLKIPEKKRTKMKERERNEKKNFAQNKIST